MTALAAQSVTGGRANCGTIVRIRSTAQTPLACCAFSKEPLRSRISPSDLCLSRLDESAAGSMRALAANGCEARLLP
jgi:hypothetical protein